MNQRAYAVAVLALVCGCEGPEKGPEIPKFDGSWHGGGWSVNVTENAAGEITGTGRYGSFIFTVEGMHVHPDVSFTGWREDYEFLTFRGEFTDDDTVEGTIVRGSGHEGSAVLTRTSQ